MEVLISSCMSWFILSVGMWADSDDEDQRAGFGGGSRRKKSDLSMPVNFVSGGIKQGDKIKKEDSEDSVRRQFLKSLKLYKNGDIVGPHIKICTCPSVCPSARQLRIIRSILTTPTLIVFMHTSIICVTGHLLLTSYCKFPPIVAVFDI